MAKKPNKTNGKAPEIAVAPATSMLEVARNQARIAELLGVLQIRQAQVERAISQIVEPAEVECEGYRKEIFALAKSIEVYAEDRKKSLTVQGQTVPVPGGGSFQWYSTPPSVRIAKKKVEKVLEAIKAKKWHRFIRTTEEIDKQALLKEPEKAVEIDGVRIKSDEKFAIRPATRDERVEHNLSTGKRQIVTSKKEAETDVEDEAA